MQFKTTYLVNVEMRNQIAHEIIVLMNIIFHLTYELWPSKLHIFKQNYWHNQSSFPLQNSWYLPDAYKLISIIRNRPKQRVRLPDVNIVDYCTQQITYMHYILKYQNTGQSQRWPLNVWSLMLSTEQNVKANLSKLSDGSQHFSSRAPILLTWSYFNPSMHK